MNYAVEVENLVKDYGDFRALDQLSLKIPEGICYGILGPNGAGKTTLMEILEGIKKKNSGNVSVLGMNIDTDLGNIQPRIGVQLQENNYFELLNIQQLLKFFLDLYPDSKQTVDRLLESVGLTENRKQRYKEMSGGQKQRFSIAVSLVNDPALLFFDEPTTGVDPQNRHFLWKLIREQKDKKKTIILTTHYMEEAENLCDELAIVERGKILVQGTPDELMKSIKGDRSITFATDGDGFAEDELNQLKGVAQFIKLTGHGENGWRLWADDFVKAIGSLYELVERKNLTMTHLEVDRVTLDDVFLNLTGKELRD